MGRRSPGRFHILLRMPNNFNKEAAPFRARLLRRKSGQVRGELVGGESSPARACPDGSGCRESDGLHVYRQIASVVPEMTPLFSGSRTQKMAVSPAPILKDLHGLPGKECTVACIDPSRSQARATLRAWPRICDLRFEFSTRIRFHDQTPHQSSGRRG